MELNKLEGRFFEDILNAELSVPARATLRYRNETLDIIVVPEINSKGLFVLKYFDAPPYEPKPDSRGVIAFDNVIFGTHPLLERAWKSDEYVALQLHTSSSMLMNRVEQQELDARVIYAGAERRGVLALDENQVVVQKTPLRKSEFCMTNFPEFLTRYRPFSIVLECGEGWRITLTQDKALTRDSTSHTGLIEKSEGRDYEIGELNDVLRALQYFFAFVAGVYCHPTAVIGYDSRSLPTLGQIGKFDLQRPNQLNWFSNDSDIQEGSYLESIFPGFWDLWKEKEDEIVAVIECYVHSDAMRKAGVPNDAVAKSYAGLEVLASLMLEKTIEGNSAGEINKVLSCNFIPNIRLDESKTPVMAKLCKDLVKAEENRERGPYLLNEIRNYVAHPLDRRKEAEIKEKHLDLLDSNLSHYFYLHDLSQFYLEYMFLSFCGYETHRFRDLLETKQH